MPANNARFRRDGLLFRELDVLLVGDKWQKLSREPLWEICSGVAVNTIGSLSLRGVEIVVSSEVMLTRAWQLPGYEDELQLPWDEMRLCAPLPACSFRRMLPGLDLTAVSGRFDYFNFR